jgi:anaerobic selenocysteine-containing dehydrogenase
MRNHDEIRRVMARVVPGYSAVAEIGRTKEEFHVDGRVRHEQRFPLPEGRARFVAIATPADDLADDELRLMTIRSEGQFNTVVYGENDRYRNQSSRDVILLNPADIARLGLAAGDRVDIGSEAATMRSIRVAPYNIAPGSAAMYYPEANALVHKRVDPRSGTPAFKNVRITIRKR